ncbi:MAG: DUF1778 domain-containing protein [Sandaracinaceae bacterium]
MTARRGRPREADAQRCSVLLRISEADRDTIDLAAERAGVSRSEYMRDAALEQARRDLGLDTRRR